MESRHAKALAFLGAVCLAGGAPASAEEPVLAVHVTHTREVRKVQGAEKKAMERELRPKINAAAEARKTLEKDLKAKHGKKKEEWPEESRAAYQEAEDAYAQAWAALEYVSVDPKGVEDSAQDVRESLAGKGLVGVKENVRIVTDPDEADLVVEVVGRRSEKTLPTQLRADLYYVAIRISAGGKMDPKRLAAVPAKWSGSKFGRPVSKLHTATEAEPWLTLDVFGEQRWANAGNNAAGVVSDYIRAHSAILAGQ